MGNGCANSGAAALAILSKAAKEKNPYSVAIIDMQMPEMDGLALARSIKADPNISATRLIMLTPFGKPLPPEAVAEHRIAACRTKPVQQSILFDCIADVLGVREGDIQLPQIIKEENESKGPRYSSKVDAIPDGRSPIAVKRLLIAEDNAVNQLVALGQLKKLGYRADAVANGLEALEALDRIRYDVVLMDCQMPEMDGYEATAKIRKREAGQRHTWIIAMTANAMKGDREKCLASGMDDYISKPTQIAALRAALSRLPRSKQSAPEEGQDARLF